MKTLELRLSGSGGQGLITAGIIMAESGIMQGYNAVQSQSYGPEARGGSSKAEVIISNEDIDYPKVEKSDIFLALKQEAFDKYSKDVKPNSIIVVDESVEVKDVASDVKVLKLPIINAASNELKLPIVANIVCVGVLTKLYGELDTKIVKEAILKYVPKTKQEANLQAFELGYKMA